MIEVTRTLPASLSSRTVAATDPPLDRVGTEERHDPTPPLPPPHAEPAAAPKAPGPATKSPGRRRIPIWTIGLIVGVSLVAAYVYVPSLYLAETDDAYVQADTVSVVPKVGAYVIALHVGDNTRFSAGELLVELDPRDFQVAVDSADADLQIAEAAKANVQQQLQEQNRIVAAAQAAIDGDRATLSFAQQQLTRYGALANNGSGTTERWQQAQSDAAEKASALQHDQAMLAAAQAQVGVLQSQIRQADAAIALQQAALARAKLNLSYTKIFAVTAGSVANRTVQVGNFVQPGQTLFSAVPREVYVIANFKETQLTHMQPGQPVTLRVDAYPALRLRGHVDSLQRGTGSNFALLPPENATGNFVKVVQRVPVKIILDDPVENLQSISPGMSVEPAVTIAQLSVWLRPFLALIGAGHFALETKPARSPEASAIS